jgi:hypothetical protein
MTVAAHNDREERKKPQPLDGSPQLPSDAGRRRGRRAEGKDDPAWLAARAARVEAERLRVEREVAARRAAGEPL